MFSHPSHLASLYSCLDTNHKKLLRPSGGGVFALDRGGGRRVFSICFPPGAYTWSVRVLCCSKQAGLMDYVRRTTARRAKQKSLQVFFVKKDLRAEKMRGFPYREPSFLHTHRAVGMTGGSPRTSSMYWTAGRTFAFPYNPALHKSSMPLPSLMSQVIYRTS